MTFRWHFVLRELPLFIILGLTGMFGNQLLYLLGIYYTNANIASIFQPAIPVWTALLAIIVRIEPYPDFRTLRGWGKCFGILLAAAGGYSHDCREEIWSRSRPWWVELSENIQFVGYIFLLGNTLSMSVYILLQKKFIFDKEDSCWKTKPVNVTAWSYYLAPCSWLWLLFITSIGQKNSRTFLKKKSTPFSMPYSLLRVMLPVNLVV